MAKLPSLITNELKGEALSYTNTAFGNVEFKQTFEVTQNKNFTWTVKERLYVRLSSDYPQGKGERFSNGIWQKMGNYENKVTGDIQILSLSGVWINGTQVSNNAYEWYKILEQERTYECSNTGRLAIRLTCGYIDSSSNEYYFDDYTIIYLTLPSFSGTWCKVNNSYKNTMPWFKINGKWKRVLAYKKIKGKWIKSNQNWKWNPEK